MSINRRFSTIVMLICLAAFALSGCGGGSGGAIEGEGGRETLDTCLQPEASGAVTMSGMNTVADASNTSDGYVMVKYTGNSDKIKVQITGPSSSIYTYTSYAGDFCTFPLTEGSGSYRLDVLEHKDGDMYALCMSEKLSVSIADEFSPFLYPNQFVWFTPDSNTVAKARELSDHSTTDLVFVEQVYKYATENIVYDTKKAAEVTVDYFPDVDETLKSNKGICFDYASLMSAMLRSQGIPTKLVVGYSGTIYHAWISVYLKETGWVDNIIEFDGTSWSLMDPTLAAGNNDSTVSDYIGDGSNYMPRFYY